MASESMTDIRNFCEMACKTLYDSSYYSLKVVWLAVVLGVTLAGCGGKNFVIREETRSFVAESAKSVAGYREFYAAIVKADKDYEMARRITYPGCPLKGDYVLTNTMGVVEAFSQGDASDEAFLAGQQCATYRSVLVPFLRDSHDPPTSLRDYLDAETKRKVHVGEHCMDLDGSLQCARVLPRALFRKVAIEVASDPLTIEVFEPELSLLVPLGAYLDALGRFAQEPSSDVVQDVEDAIERLDKVAQKLDESPVNSDVKEKLGKISTLVSFLQRLHKGQKNAEELRALVKENGHEIESLISQLAAAADTDYSQIYNAGVSLRVTLYQNALETRSESGDVGGRILLLDRYSEAVAVEAGMKKWQAKYPEASPAGEALREVARSHQALCRVIAGNFSEEQKRRAVRQSWRNFKEGLRAIDGVLDTFGVP